MASIVINNFNYGRYLAEAVDSALAQSYPNTEVVVVDDGSTDNSRDLIASYGDRIHAVLKHNGGQASALNAGFAAASGAFVLFLDADDRLYPQAVEAAIEELGRAEEMSTLRFTMRVVDAEGSDTGRATHPATPLTSSMVFPRSVLERIMPIPESSFRICADQYLGNAAHLLGSPVCVDTVGGEYRLHGANYFSSGFDQFDLEPVRREVALRRDAQRYIRALAERIEKSGAVIRATAPEDRRLAVLEMVLARLDERSQLEEQPGAFRVFREGIGTVWRYRGVEPKRWLYYAWFSVMLVVPRPVARFLAWQFLASQSWARRVFQ